MSTTTSKGTGNTTEAGGKSWTVEHETKVRFSPKDGKRWADVVDVGDADRARLIAAAPETAAELAALKAKCERLRKLFREIDEYLSGHPQNAIGCGSKLHRDIQSALRPLDTPKCETCEDKGYVYEGEAVTGRGPDDVFPEKVACPDCRPRETTP